MNKHITRTISTLLLSSTLALAQTEGAYRDTFDFMRSYGKAARQVELEEAVPKWNFSIGGGARIGMNIGEISGGVFDARSTGYVGKSPSTDPNYTEDWGADSPAQIVDIGTAPGGTYRLWQLRYQDVHIQNDDNDTSGAGVTASLTRDVLWRQNCVVGLRLSLASYFGMKASNSAFIDDVAHDFHPTVGVGGKPVSGGAAAPVSINAQRTFRERNNVEASAYLFQLGFGPEIVLQDDKESWIRLSLYPSLSLNYAATSVDISATTGNESANERDILLGVGLTASAVFGLTESCSLYTSVGYDYVTPQSVSAGDYSFDIDYSGLTLGVSVLYTF